MSFFPLEIRPLFALVLHGKTYVFFTTSDERCKKSAIFSYFYFLKLMRQMINSILYLYIISQGHMGL